MGARKHGSMGRGAWEHGSMGRGAWEHGKGSMGAKRALTGQVLNRDSFTLIRQASARVTGAVPNRLTRAGPRRAAPPASAQLSPSRRAGRWLPASA